VGFVWASVWNCWPNAQSRWTSALASSHRWSACAPLDDTVLAARPDGPPPAVSCGPCNVAAVPLATHFGWRSSVVGGRSRGNCAPVVLTGLSGPSVTGTVGVATGVGATVGVGITGGADTPALPVVGTVGAMTGAAMLGGAMTRPDGAVTPCGPSPPWVPLTAPCPLSPSSSDSSLSGWVRGAMGQRPTFAGGGPVTYRLWCGSRQPSLCHTPRPCGTAKVPCFRSRVHLQCRARRPPSRGSGRPP
jgi:hypothetical protein